jgi:hypothetical protein
MEPLDGHSGPNEVEVDGCDSDPEVDPWELLREFRDQWNTWVIAAEAHQRADAFRMLGKAYDATDVALKQHNERCGK